MERTRRIIDLFLVSVLLDAGAGDTWSYLDPLTKENYNRTEGLAVASYNMFCNGIFSSDKSNPYQVDACALENLSVEKLAQGFQATADNPIAGLKGRSELMRCLGQSLQSSSEIFGRKGRPGYIIDYILSDPSSLKTRFGYEVQIPVLWNALMNGLIPIWPTGRAQINGQPLGDAWPSKILGGEGDKSIVPFHKLTQWLCYSLMVPMSRLANVIWIGSELLTGLPEYRNGGLLIDLGLLELKEAPYTRGIKCFEAQKVKGEKVPMFTPDDDVIVEWRAVTVGMLDRIRDGINNKLGAKLSLAQCLEAGTWKVILFKPLFKIFTRGRSVSFY